MKITLKEWRQIAQACEKLQAAKDHAARVIVDIALMHLRAGHTDESEMLLELETKLNNIVIDAASVQPQSEWMGGNSHDPKNHRLREPNRCPMPRRHFTAEELAEVGAQCFGPCDWVYTDTPLACRWLQAAVSYAISNLPDMEQAFTENDQWLINGRFTPPPAEKDYQKLLKQLQRGQIDVHNDD